MRILLDECLPRRLKKALTGHDTRTAPEMGWAGKANGELLALAVGEGFDAFVTIDKNLSRQLPAGLSITIVSLSAKSNRFEDLLPLMPQVLSHLRGKKPRRVIRIVR